MPLFFMKLVLLKCITSLNSKNEQCLNKSAIFHNNLWMVANGHHFNAHKSAVLERLRALFQDGPPSLVNKINARFLDVRSSSYYFLPGLARKVSTENGFLFCNTLLHSLLTATLCLHAHTVPADGNFALSCFFYLALQAFPPSAPTIWQPPRPCSISSPLLPNLPAMMLIGTCGSLWPGSLLSLT